MFGALLPLILYAQHLINNSEDESETTYHYNDTTINDNNYSTDYAPHPHYTYNRDCCGTCNETDEEDYIMKIIPLYGFTDAKKDTINRAKFVLPVYICEFSNESYDFYLIDDERDVYTRYKRRYDIEQFTKVRLITEPDKEYYIKYEDIP